MDQTSDSPSTTSTAMTAPPRQIDAEWRRWIAENVLLNKGGQSIVDAMVRSGFAPETASAEVEAAMAHPYIKAARELARPVENTPAVRDGEFQLKKHRWVLECQRRAARQAANFGTVPRVFRPSRQEFLDRFYAANQPVLIEGAMDNWPALGAWTAENLKRRLGSQLVEVQANRSSDANYERDSTRLRQTMPFGEFVDRVESAGCSNDWYITAKNAGPNALSLAELWNDIVAFPEYLRDDLNNRGFFWFGPAGTITPLHHDLTNNLMAQVRGSKLVRLVAPFDLPRVYNDVHCYSQVDLGNPDFTRFPLLKDATIIDVTLHPGEVLFLPVGWWHYVRSLEISITMTFTNFVFDNDFYSFYSAG